MEDEWTLIAAVSARALAAAAARVSRRIAVLDCFADRDTRAIAERCQRVRAPSGFQLDARALCRAADSLAPGAPLVYGSGFEARTVLLSRLARNRPLLGNQPAVVAAVKAPRSFFPLLDRLGIVHPEVRYSAPTDAGGWLVKRSGGAGGSHVRPADGRRIAPGEYFQRHAQGDSCSVLFLADGRRAMVVGWNLQWTDSLEGRSFVYAGAASRWEPPPTVQEDLLEKLNALVAATGLVGLNGLDFLVGDHGWTVLEINPRPTATMELYDPDFSPGLFHLHVEAVRGVVPARTAPGPARAHAIVRASDGCDLGAGFTFPDWCRDLPETGERFRPGDPICTVVAEGESAERARTLAEGRRETVSRLIRESALTAIQS